MDAWNATTTPSPDIKFENSPAESFLSTPGEMYPSLFGTSPASSTMNPLEIMTPQSFSEEKVDAAVLAELGAVTEGSGAQSASGQEKKSVKKRKSWGQVLPEPKTNLPPRYAATLPLHTDAPLRG